MRPDEQQGPDILGATLAVTIAALITMITRLFVRIKMIRNVGWDVSILARYMEGDIADELKRTTLCCQP